MMGAHHAACGAAAWIALTSTAVIDTVIPVINVPFHMQMGLGLFEVSPVAVVTGALLTAGAALLPDADHHNATIAHSMPPVSNVIVSGIAAVSGGHRHGTHSFIGIAFFTLVAWIAGFVTPNAIGTLFGNPANDSFWGNLQIGPAIMSMILIGFALHTLKFIPRQAKKSGWILSGIIAALILFLAPHEQGWFPIAVGLGAIVHILGDMMTTGGCNLVWPFKLRPPKIVTATPILNQCWKENGYLSFPVLGNAGSFREWLFLIPLSAYAIYGICAGVVMGVQGMM